MTSQPPSGPPAGPVPPPPGPGPDPRRPRGGARHGIALAVGAALVALVLAVVVVASLRGDGRGGPAAPPSLGGTRAAAAHALASNVVLAPSDWGPGFGRADPYEFDPADEDVVLGNCEYGGRAARSGTLAAVQRVVLHPSSGLTGTSEVRVFTDDPTAKRYVAEVPDQIRRCPTQHGGKALYTGVHETPPPEVPGLEEVVAEEGSQVTADDGTGVDNRYLVLTGRTGRTVLRTSAVAGAGQEARIRRVATDALLEMQRRLGPEHAAARR
ncbi:hypothetical protein ACFXOS_27685 [Streptomyces sp. NPDC059175]|uniref:hypothetical protein n=1 Tax=Streptomyces sp. NPDC059175 TaxID=3346757 RepID=UPI00367701CB